MVAEWQAHAARLLRTEGLPAATSSVIDATRLAVTLAAVRTLPVPGLTEMRDASLAALCHGDDIALRVIERRLVIGERVGEVDESAPQPPLLADLTRQQKKLRLKPEGFPKEIALDLRSTAGLAKSVLLHRLALIGVNWGQLLDASAGRGTFREIWTIEWQPELAVALAEAVVHGPTVARAADGAAIERSNTETDCAKLAELVRQCLLADLGTAANASIVRLQGVAVQAGDVFALARAVVPLVDILRYGTAREMPTGALTQLVTSIVVDTCSGLRYACHGLDETAAGEARMALADLNRAVTLLSDEHVLGQWQRALESCANDTRVAALLRGFAVRLLYDASRLDADAAAAALSLALSPSVRIADAGAWFEGFLNDAGDIIVVDTALFRIVDEWIGSADRRDLRRVVAIAATGLLELRFGDPPAAAGARPRRGRRRPRARFGRSAGGDGVCERRAATAGGTGARRSMSERERQRRWRLALGDPSGEAGGLSGDDIRLDKALGALYGSEKQPKGGLGSSSPRVARWLGDIREFFPTPVVQVIQKDAYERLGLQRMLLEPEFLQAMEADVHLVADLISLNAAMPEKTKETAREVVDKVVRELLAKLEQKTAEAVRGALNRAKRTRRPRMADIDWPKTIGANLRHYQPEYRTVVPETLIGFARKARTPRRPRGSGAVRGPVGLDGDQRRLQLDIRRRPGVTAGCRYQTGLLRHQRDGSDRDARRPRRRAVRRAARRRDRHQPRRRLLRRADSPAVENPHDPDQRSLRRRRRRAAAGPLQRADRERRESHHAAGAHR